jgi:hypothetical protein
MQTLNAPVKERHAPADRKTGWLWKSVAQCLLLIPLLLLGLEFVFYIAGIGEQEFLRRDAVHGFLPMEGKSVTWRKEGFSRAKFNSLGMRDYERSISKPPGMIRVAVIGDSYVEALQVDTDKTFCAELERELKQRFPQNSFEVLNFGVSAHNLGQMMLRLENLALKFEPDVVLLAVRHHTCRQLPQNPGGGFIWARPSFLLDSDGQLTTDYAIQEKYARSSAGKREKWTGWLREHSRVWGVSSICVEQILKWWNKLKEPEVKAVQEVSKKTAFDRTTKVAHPVVINNSENERCARSIWPVADAIIARMHADCVSKNIKFGIVRLGGTRGDNNYVESELLAQTARRLNIPYCDTTPVLNQEYQNGRGDEIWYEGHFAPFGHKLIAKEIMPLVTTQLK